MHGEDCDSDAVVIVNDPIVLENDLTDTRNPKLFDNPTDFWKVTKLVCGFFEAPYERLRHSWEAGFRDALADFL